MNDTNKTVLTEDEIRGLFPFSEKVGAATIDVARAVESAVFVKLGCIHDDSHVEFARAVLANRAVLAKLCQPAASEAEPDAWVTGDDDLDVALNMAGMPGDGALAQVEAVERLKRRLAASEADPIEFDSTDAEHPAWWRGHYYTTRILCERIAAILDGKDDGTGVSSQPWEGVRRRLLAMADAREAATATIQAGPSACPTCRQWEALGRPVGSTFDPCSHHCTYETVDTSSDAGAVPGVPDDDAIAEAWMSASEVDGIEYHGPSFGRGYRAALLAAPPAQPEKQPVLGGAAWQLADMESIVKHNSDLPAQPNKQAASKREFTDGTRTLRQDCISAVRDFRKSRPEEDETWESWFAAAFDLCESRLIAIFEEHDAAPTAQPEKQAMLPDITSSVINEACWKFIEAMPHKIPAPIWNNLKPAIYATVCHVLGATPAPIQQAAPAAESAEPLTHRCKNCDAVFQGAGCPRCRLAAPIAATAAAQGDDVWPYLNEWRKAVIALARAPKDRLDIAREDEYRAHCRLMERLGYPTEDTRIADAVALRDAVLGRKTDAQGDERAALLQLAQRIEESDGCWPLSIRPDAAAAIRAALAAAKPEGGSHE